MYRCPLVVIPLIVAAAACGGGSATPDAATADIDASAIDAHPDPDGGATVAEGLITVMFQSVNQVEPDLVDVTFDAWRPSAVDPHAVFDHREREIASGAALAIGSCVVITKPPLPPVTEVAGGDDVVFTSGAATIPLEVEAPGRYFGRDETDPARHLGRDLALVLGTGSGPHGGPGMLPLPRVPALTAAAPSLTCLRGSPCSLGVTVEDADELYVVIALGQVCRLGPAEAPAIPSAALAAEADGPHSLRLHAVRRRQVALGGADYAAVVVHTLSMAFDLVPAAGAPPST